MKQVRFKTFETNSSSSHSLILISKEEMDQWKAGKMWFHDGRLKTIQQAIEDHLITTRWYYEKYPHKLPPEEDLDAWRKHIEEYDGLMSYEEYVDGPDTYEAMSETYTTKSGEEVVAICRYYAS